MLWAARAAMGPGIWPYFYGIVLCLNFVALNVFPAIISFNLRTAIRDEQCPVLWRPLSRSDRGRFSSFSDR